MKPRLFLLPAALLFAAGVSRAAPPDTSVVITARSSGHVTHQVESGVHRYYLYSGDLHYCYWLNVYPPVTLYEHTYVGFDLHAIPDTALIQAATISFCQFYDSFSTPYVDPVLLECNSWIPESVFAAVGSGAHVGAQIACQPGWNLAVLNAVGLQAIKDALTRDSVFFALKIDGGVSDGEAYGFSADESLRPRLQVNYLPSGISESGRPAEPRALSIAPNPASRTATVSWPCALADPLHLVLRDCAGRIVLSTTAATAPATVDLLGLPVGAYFVTARAGSLLLTDRLLVQHR